LSIFWTKSFHGTTGIGCDDTEPLEWKTMLITRAAWKIKPGGMSGRQPIWGKKEIIKFI
jgi:hypothetical protein